MPLVERRSRRSSARRRRRSARARSRRASSGRTRSFPSARPRRTTSGGRLERPCRPSCPRVTSSRIMRATRAHARALTARARAAERDLRDDVVGHQQRPCPRPPCRPRRSCRARRPRRCRPSARGGRCASTSARRAPAFFTLSTLRRAALRLRRRRAVDRPPSTRPSRGLISPSAAPTGSGCRGRRRSSSRPSLHLSSDRRRALEHVLLVAGVPSLFTAASRRAFPASGCHQLDRRLEREELHRVGLVALRASSISFTSQSVSVGS